MLIVPVFRLLRILVSCSFANAAVVTTPSALAPNISQNEPYNDYAPSGPPPGPPGSSSSTVMCWYPHRARSTIHSFADCSSALDILLHEPEVLRQRIFGIIHGPGVAPVPDVWKHRTCSIQLRYLTHTADFDPDRFRYFDVASVAQSLMNACINGVKAPQGGSGWVGNNRGYFVTVQGSSAGPRLGADEPSTLASSSPPSGSPIDSTKPIPTFPLNATLANDETQGSPKAPRRRSLTPGPRSQPVSPPPSLPPPLSSPPSSIHCFARSAGKPTTIDTCRPTLNHIRQFYTPYRTSQLFRMYRSPADPFTPPISHLHISPSDCLIQVFSRDGSVEDRFSWEEVRRKATEVLEQCEEIGDGVGGTVGLGRGIGWRVVVLGVGTVPEEGSGESDGVLDGMGLGLGLDGGNGTSGRVQKR